MYLRARGNQALVLDADTGKVSGVIRRRSPSPLTPRGVVYWPGERARPPGSAHGRPTAARPRAATGRPAAGFGRDGYVDIHAAGEGCALLSTSTCILGAIP